VPFFALSEIAHRIGFAFGADNAKGGSSENSGQNDAFRGWGAPADTRIFLSASGFAFGYAVTSRSASKAPLRFEPSAAYDCEGQAPHTPL
jgi:hypothetical protein